MKACDRAVNDCPCSTNPLENFSSEAPDPDIFLSFNTGWGTTHHPNPGDTYQNPDGYGYCTSTVSQEAADQCAANCQLDNQMDNGNPDCGGAGGNSGPDDGNDGGNRDGAKEFSNTTQECSFTCDDGGPPFTWTVVAGYARGTSQAEADNVASSLACRLAIAHRICPGTLDNKGSCADSDYFGTVKAKTGPSVKLPLTWTMRSGNLPPGLDLDTDNGGDNQLSVTVGIIGHVSAGASGDYVFALRATDADGNFNERSYKITVLVIAACPSNATPGIPYSFQMQTTGGTGPFKWQVTTGTLPPGLTMTDAGLITGTTTTVQAKYPLTFSVLDTSTSISCTKTCTLYNQCPGANWLDMTFSASQNGVSTCPCGGANTGNQNSFTNHSLSPTECPAVGTLCDYSYNSTSVVSATAFTLRISVNYAGITGFFQHQMNLFKNNVFLQDLDNTPGFSFAGGTGNSTADVALGAGTYRIQARYNVNTSGSVTFSFNNKC